ncbi:SANT/Myb domain [Macleaya cordata]|uniref:SANT/Myb domain n=1 Tax=Macleaya cordata TaxID=56857 RepID=A0A200QE28_MACCD|nr:SANT/Myb domain [Macleaya cordata]
MAFEMDPFADLLCEPVPVNARAGAKFQPKARPRCKKEVPVLVSSSLSDSTKEKQVTTDSRHVDTSKAVSPSVDCAEIGSTHIALSSVDTSKERPCSSTLDGSSSHLVTQGPVNSTAALHSEFSISDGDRSSGPMDISPQFVRKGDVGSTKPLFSEDSKTFNIQGDKQAGFGGSRGETADIFSDLESLDDILSQPAISNVSTVRKFQPKVKVNGQLRNKLPISRPVTSDADCSISIPEAPGLHAPKDLEEGPSPPILPSVDSTFRASSSAPANSNPDFLASQELLSNRETAASGNHGDLLMDDGRLEREEEAFHGLQSVDVISQATTTTGDAHLVPPETEFLEDLTPAYPPDSFIDFSTMGFSDSLPRDLPPELQATEELENLADASGTKIFNPGEFVDSQAVRVTSGKKDERSVLTASEGNETGKSLRQLRKRLTAPVAADEMATETQENQDMLSEPSNNSLADEGENNDDDDEYRGEETSNRKRARKLSKKPVVGNEKTVRRRKKTSEGSDSLDKEPPKKKFSHSTRRNRRRVDKVLLETPDEEIDPQKLIIKDLILLAEAKERLLIKDANVSKNSFANQSNSFTQDAPYNEEDPFGSTQDDDQPAPSAQHSSFKLNYHSFMDRTPKERWTKQDTELFYQGIRQFGTDFAMIQQLFPGRTRHQVKLKYKKEERQQPMRLSDALTNRSKDHSHFELVIERLQKAAAEAEQNSNRDEESIGLTGEEEEVTPETNEEVTKAEDEGGAKTERKEEEEVGEADMEAEEEVVNTNQAYSPTVKSHHCEIEEEDVYDRWSQYKSDYDVF